LHHCDLFDLLLFLFCALSLSALCSIFFIFLFTDPATLEIYTLSLHDALPICKNLSVLTFLLGAFLLVFFLPVYAWLFECFTAYVQYRHAEYVLTDRRVIAKKGRWGRYLEIADYKKSLQ